MPAKPISNEEYLENVAQRFWARVDKSGDCWVWTGRLSTSGYGQTHLHRPIPKTELTHRLAWKLENKQEIPKGMVICHTCDNRPCVRPTHLFLGTYSDNTQDAIKKGRVCRGDDQWTRKYPERLRTAAKGNHKSTKHSAEVLIKATLEYKAGTTGKQIKAKYGLTTGAIYSILKGSSRPEVLNSLAAELKDYPHPNTSN